MKQINRHYGENSNFLVSTLAVLGFKGLMAAILYGGGGPICNFA
jgi:hypothetical protein